MADLTPKARALFNDIKAGRGPTIVGNPPVGSAPLEKAGYIARSADGTKFNLTVKGQLTNRL